MLELHFKLKLSDDPFGYENVRDKTNPWLRDGSQYWLEQVNTTVHLDGDDREMEEFKVASFTGGTGHILRGLLLISILQNEENIIKTPRSREFDAGATSKAISHYQSNPIHNPKLSNNHDYIGKVFPVIWVPTKKKNLSDYSLDKTDRYSGAINSVNLLFEGAGSLGLRVKSYQQRKCRVKVTIYLNNDEVKYPQTIKIFEYLSKKYKLKGLPFDDYEYRIPKKQTSAKPSKTVIATYHRDDVSDCVPNFIGRHWVMKSVENYVFTSQDPSEPKKSGYFCLMGPPGIGKSTICRQIATKQQLPFVYFQAGKTSAIYFQEKLYREVQKKYPQAKLAAPCKGYAETIYFEDLLKSIATQNEGNFPIVIVIDALDEAEPEVINSLPRYLPDGIFLITSFRGSVKTKCPLNGRSSELKIEMLDPKDSRIQNDVASYLDTFASDPAIIKFSQDNNITVKNLITQLKDKSDGNFIFAHYVINSLRQENVLYNSVSDIPYDLESYYERHVRLLFDHSVESGNWYEYWLPTIIIISNINGSVPRELIQELLGACTDDGIREISKVISALFPFLVTERIQAENDDFLAYRIYHSDFTRYLRERADLFDDGHIKFETLSNVGKKLIESLIYYYTDELVNVQAPSSGSVLNRMGSDFLLNNVFQNKQFSSIQEEILINNHHILYKLLFSILENGGANHVLHIISSLSSACRIKKSHVDLSHMLFRLYHDQNLSPGINLTFEQIFKHLSFYTHMFNTIRIKFEQHLDPSCKNLKTMTDDEIAIFDRFVDIASDVDSYKSLESPLTRMLHRDVVFKTNFEVTDIRRAPRDPDQEKVIRSILHGLKEDIDAVKAHFKPGYFSPMVMICIHRVHDKSIKHPRRL